MQRLKGRGEGKCNPVHPIPCIDGTTVLPFVFPSRSEQIKRLKKGTKENPIDLLVIGGGCVGTGVAMDAACRGIEVPPHKEACLCERLGVLVLRQL